VSGAIEPRVVSANPVDAKSRLLQWARGSLAPLATVVPGPPWEDLSPLAQMIGDATVVGLSEGVHCAAEPLEFRNRVFEYLVEHLGFAAIAIESGIAESRIVHEYVRGSNGDVSNVLEQGISWGMDRLPQNRALVEWMRRYNASHERKINFYGFDVSGSLASADAVRTHDTALKEALGFLGDVDAKACAAFRARLDPLMRSMHFTLQGSHHDAGYERLNQPQRDALTAAIADLIIWLERHEARYSAATSARGYAWGYRAAIGARQVDNWLRQVPVGWNTSQTNTLQEALSTFYPAAADVRERAQADNLDWIISQEGGGKVLVFASRYHLSSAALKPGLGGEERAAQEVAGTYLRRRFGSRWLTIGNLIGEGEVECGAYRERLARAPAESVDGLMEQAGAPLFLLDLRTAPDPVARWLSQEHTLAAGAQTLKLPLLAAFDVLFYIDKVTPACRAAAPSRSQG
jgi:erythromycin esterase